MQIPFNKYQGTGNDFIIIDNRKSIFNPSDKIFIERLCDRRFGIGADGLILISLHDKYDFEMRYFNSDGNESSMCGNGGRCAAAFSYAEAITCKQKHIFFAFDGPHEAIVSKDIVRLQMNDVTEIINSEGDYFINTGSPHFVRFVENVRDLDVSSEGKKIRWSDRFKPHGTNVNFVELLDNGIFVRTFERGVEDETLSCGTGVTASSIAAFLSGRNGNSVVNVKTLGGDLSVEMNQVGNKITDIRLCGPAKFVFEGMIEA
jgi:diaminopimelate epimerase